MYKEKKEKAKTTNINDEIEDININSGDIK